MRVEESIQIAAPRERVWPTIAEPSGYCDFMVGASWQPVPGEPTEGPRARYWLSVQVAATDLGGVVELVEVEPPHILAWTSVSGIDNRGRWILRDRGSETAVTLRVSYQVPGGLLALVASRLGAPILRRDVRQSLAGLKELVERPKTEPESV